MMFLVLHPYQNERQFLLRERRDGIHKIESFINDLACLLIQEWYDKVVEEGLPFQVISSGRHHLWLSSRSTRAAGMKSLIKLLLWYPRKHVI